MTDLEAIALRTSRRAYTGRLDKEQLRALQDTAAKMSLQCGLSIRVMEDGAEAFGGITKSYGMFSGVHSLVVLAGKETDPDLFEKAGHCGERLVLDATKMGLGTCWVGGTFDRRRLAQNLPAGQRLVAVITAGPAKEQKGFVEKTVRRFTGDHNRPPEMFYTADVAAPPEWFMAGVAAAARAPSAVNRQPVRFRLENGAVSATVPGEQTYELIDLGIAKLHFEIAAGGRFAWGNGAVFEKEG